MSIVGEILRNNKQFLYYFKYVYFLIDDDEVYNNPNLHSEEQDDLEIPDGKV